MSIEDFAYRVAHDYPGGVRPLATRMRPPTDDDPAPNYGQVLINKLNPNCGTHSLLAREFEQIVDFTGTNLEAADYFAAKVGALVVRLDAFAGSDLELLDAFMSVMKELGELSAEFQKDYADGNISADDLHRISKEARDVHMRLCAFVMRVEQISEFSAAGGK